MKSCPYKDVTQYYMDVGIVPEILDLRERRRRTHEETIEDIEGSITRLR